MSEPKGAVEGTMYQNDRGEVLQLREGEWVKIPDLRDLQQDEYTGDFSHELHMGRRFLNNLQSHLTYLARNPYRARYDEKFDDCYRLEKEKRALTEEVEALKLKIAQQALEIGRLLNEPT